ncbi:MAG: hypothetical protein LUH15_09685 [Tannerellaceae bacterium]|nr:hypothetical protein [Tannerellaceae bacterium]
METKKLVILFLSLFLVTSCSNREIWIITGDDEPAEKIPVSVRFVLEGTPQTKSGSWKYDSFFSGHTQERTNSK